MEPVLISIVTPSLNGERWIERCIRNVATQTYPAIEHIVVDGGSTDRTREIVALHPHVRWYSRPGTRQTDAINFGFAVANGDILTWLNVDDQLAPDAAMQAATTLLGTSGFWVYGDNRIRRGQTEVIRRAPSSVRMRHLERGNPLSQTGTFLHKRTLDAVGPLDESLDLVMDLDLWIRLMQRQLRPTYIPRAVGIAEIHDRSKSGTRAPADFLRECVRVWIKNHLNDAASVGAGRYFAQVNGSLNNRETLQGLLSKAEVLFDIPNQIHEGRFRAGFYTELLRVEHGRPFRRLRHLAHSEPWRYRQTRDQLFAAVARKLTKSRFPRMA